MGRPPRQAVLEPSWYRTIPKAWSEGVGPSAGCGASRPRSGPPPPPLRTERPASSWPGAERQGGGGPHEAGFVGGPDGAQPGQGARGPRAAHHPGAEAEGVPASPLPLALGEADSWSLPLALLGRDEVLQRPVQGAEDFRRTSRSPSTRPAWGCASSPRSRAGAGQPPTPTSSPSQSASGTDPIPSSKQSEPHLHANGTSVLGPGWDRARTGRPGCPSCLVPGGCGNGPGCAMGRCPSPRAPGAEAGQDLGHVPHQIVIDL